MLKEAHQLIERIKSGIFHKSTVAIKADEHYLEVITTIRDSRNGEPHSFTNIITVEQMTDMVSEGLWIASYIDQANAAFRGIYVKPTERP
jgi:hypothetical protein